MDAFDFDGSNNSDGSDNLDLTDPVDKRHEKVKPPSVLGEEDPFSGDATTSESPDIDEELAKVGLSGDDANSTPDPLGVDREIDEDEEAV
jgi:hypothetical protein